MELWLLHHDARLTALLLCTTVLKLGIPRLNKIDDLAHICRPILMRGKNLRAVLRDVCVELYPTVRRKHIGTSTMLSEFVLGFRYLASFRNVGGSEASRVEN